MEVKLEKSFPIAAPADAAWRLLSDIKNMAECMPGAQITEQVDAAHYNGQVNVKLGPTTAAFKGTLEVKSADKARREIRILGKGTDMKGASAASMDLTARILEAGDGNSELVGVSQVTVSGKLASFAGRMLVQVSDQILKQFGANFANRVVAAAEGAGAAPAAVKVTEQPRELNVFALLGGAVVGFIKGLFGRKRSKLPL